MTRLVTTLDDNSNIQETTLTKRKTMYAVNNDNLVIDTNKTGDMLLVMTPSATYAIIYKGGTLIHQSISRSRIEKKWKNKKNT